MFRLGVLLVVVGVVLADPALDSSVNRVSELREFLEQTTRDDGVTLEERSAKNPKAKAWENSGKFEGDILLDQEEIQRMVASVSSRKAYIWPNTRWPQNTVVYEFANGHFTANQRSSIINAINDISRNTCVRFRLRQPWESNFVRLTNNPTGCYAHVGFWASRGVHTMNLANGCFLHTTIVHEWLHIIGFVHMQSTYTRNNYVRVLWQNMLPGMEHNFDMYDNRVVSNLGLPYEYASNMHYDAYGFSINGQPTLQAIHNDNGMMGQQQFITPTDWRRVNRHYNCPGAWN